VRFVETVERLRAALAEPLPGAKAQRAMASLPRPGWKPGQVPEGARPAGVLILLYPVEREAWLPLTVRTQDVESHRGQVSLPGGALEAGESSEAGALREAEEEVGIPAGEVEVLGRLTPLYVPPSGFAVQPVVGALPRRPSFRPEPAEVERVLETPLGALARSAVERREREDGRGMIPFFPVEGQRVWGATAMILAELVSLLGFRPWERAPGS
jgi:8-oxo-dGTP pyrophosphatase MutT (NUDIX family)